MKYTAKDIPGVYFFLILLILLPLQLVPYPCSARGEKLQIYYLRRDVLFSDNTISRANLLMLPGDEEFRLENFSPIVIRGEAAPSLPGPERNLETRALHSALASLLETKGLKSVKNLSTTVNGSTRQDTIMSYEGAVILPAQPLARTFDPEKRVFRLTLKVRFAPLSFPDRWRRQQLIKKGTDLFSDLFLYP